MAVNATKTEIVKFRRGGKPSKLDEFTYDGETIEIHLHNFLPYFTKTCLPSDSDPLSPLASTSSGKTQRHPWKHVDLASIVSHNSGEDL